MYSRQTRSTTVARPQTVEAAVTFTPEELERLDAAARQSGFDLPVFVQNAALEAAHIKTTSAKGRGGGVDAGWLTEAFNETPENTTEDKEEGSELKAAVIGASDSAATGSEKSTSVSTSTPKKGVVGEQSSLAKGLGPVWEIRKALGKERLHGLGWTREHLAFVLKLSVVGVRKLEHEGKAPVKSKVAREQLLELAKAVSEPNEVVKMFIKENGK